MDARYLSPTDREAFKRVITDRRDAVGAVIKRMEAKHWFTDDIALLSLKASWNSLHAAVQAMGALDGLP